MQNANKIIGVDISKDRFHFAKLDLASGACEFKGQSAMAADAIAQFIGTHCAGDSVHVVMEATGNYHLRLSHQLERAQIVYSVVNPLCTKRFSDLKMYRTRNDTRDSIAIAEYGREQKPKPSVAAPAPQQDIRTITTILEQLKKQETQLTNLIHAIELIPEVNSDYVASLKKPLDAVRTEMTKLEKDRQQIVKSHYEPLAKQIRTIPGIGPKTTTAFIGRFGDLAAFDNYKQVVAAIGINPKPQQSGTSKNIAKGISKQGDATLRTLFYLAALSASRYNIACKELYQRLIQKGKSRKTALIAVANKLVKQIFTIVKKGVPFVNGYGRESKNPENPGPAAQKKR